MISRSYYSCSSCRQSALVSCGKAICVLTLYLLLLLNRFDRTLGGLEMELRLREHLARLFNEQRKGQNAKDVRENPRAMAKLLREANRLKTVLSANADHMAQVMEAWWRAGLWPPQGWRAFFSSQSPVPLNSVFSCPESRHDQNILTDASSHRLRA